MSRSLKASDHRLLVWAASVSAGALAWPAAVCAQTAVPVALTWSAPDGCGSAREVELRMRKLLGSSRPHEAMLRAEATLTRNDGGIWHLTLVIHAGKSVGERQFDGASCADLAGAAAVTLALLVSSDQPLSNSELGGNGEREGTGPPPPSTGPPPSPPVVETSPQRSPPRVTPRARWHALIGFPLASLGLGPLARPSLGAAFAGGLELGKWSWVMQERAWLTQTLAAGTEPDVRAEVRRVDATLWTCRDLLPAPLEVAPCLALSLQHVAARGAGTYVTPRTATSTWFAGGLGLRARYVLTPWFKIMGAGDVQLETSRPRIALDGLGKIGQLGPAAVTIVIGPEWTL
jgi:hypothetical protein